MPSILCVDPDRESQVVLREALRDFEAVFAGNAYDALRELNRRVFDAYLMESWLPDFSGLALCREIHRTDPRGPVILCLSAARKEDRLLALRAGANAYVSKPLEPSELLRQLRVLLAMTDIERTGATAAARAAIGDELTRHGAELLKSAGAARQATFRAVERICRTKAFVAYSERGGTRANFERCWNEWFSDVAADYATCAHGASMLPPANVTANAQQKAGSAERRTAAKL
jgi:two-component system, chemotaxis family, chemotaxis protein CheY